MSHKDFIKENFKLTKCSILNENEKNISKFLLSLIINKKSKIIQIGDIDNESEKFISQVIENPIYYEKMKTNDFNFNKFQKKKKFTFNTLIIGLIPKTYEFCITYSCLFRQMEYVYIHYNAQKKLCKALRCPFAKKNFYSLLKIPYEKKKENIGMLINNKLIQYEIFKKGDLRGESGDFHFSFGVEKISRTSIINHLIKKYQLKNYLEIGIRDGTNFNRIHVANKTGVDPEPSSDCKGNNIFLMTSDEYFEYIKDSKKTFDIIFIDGLHLEEQVSKDIQNSLRHLNKNGFIIMHDCNPPTRFHQRENYLVGGKYLEWNGTTWRSYAQLRMNNSNLKMYVVNTDWGVGIIQKGNQECYKKLKELKYQNLQEDRDELLNLISVYDFLRFI